MTKVPLCRLPLFWSTMLLLVCRRTMASHAAAAGTQYAVRLKPPMQGSILAVRSPDAKASATSSYEVVRKPQEPFNGMQVCVWVDSTNDSTDGTNGTDSKEKTSTSRSGPFCFDREQGELPINGLQVGSHRVSAAVVAPAAPEKGVNAPTLKSPIASTELAVVAQNEFLPSYEWQRVYPWQSVPPGLEVVLPLDGVSETRARIPPSWRLLLYVPGGGEGGEHPGFFVRTELREESTVSELRQEIARQPRFGLPVERVTLTLDGRVLRDVETVGGLDLFNRQRDIVAVVDWSMLSPAASPEIDKEVVRQDFEPSYEWQPVHPWQSVPPGLEVVLPMDGVSEKRARIPPSWRLQLYVPEGGGRGGRSGFFVRTDILEGSTVLELRREIARQPRCGLPLERIALTLDGRVLRDDETAGSLDLFNRQRDVVPVMDWSSSAVP